MTGFFNFLGVNMNEYHLFGVPNSRDYPQGWKIPSQQQGQEPSNSKQPNPISLCLEFVMMLMFMLMLMMTITICLPVTVLVCSDQTKNGPSSCRSDFGRDHRIRSCCFSPWKWPQKSLVNHQNFDVPGIGLCYTIWLIAPKPSDILRLWSSLVPPGAGHCTLVHIRLHF